MAGLLLIVLTHRSGAADPDPKPVVVPFELLKSKHMAVKIKINGKGPYRMIFDTGAPLTLLNTKVAQESELLPKGAQPPVLGPFVLPVQLTIKTLEVGDLKAENASAVIMDHPTVEAIAKVVGPIEGVIGFPFFARYRMTLDYQAKQLTFVPNGHKPEDIFAALKAALAARNKLVQKVLAPAALWGLVVDKDAGDEKAGVAIKEVLPGSAADAAGFHPGDRLLTLDGRWTDTVPDCYLAASHIKPETTVKVVVQRTGAKMELIVKPRQGL